MAETAAPASSARSLRVEKYHVAAFLGLLAFLDLIVVALAAYALDNIIDGTGDGFNGVTYHLAIMSLIAGMLTLAAIISGLLHFRHYNAGSLSGASTTALIAWVLTLLAFGLACKQIDAGGVKSKMRALEAFVFILAFFETLYVLILHLGMFDSKYGVGY